MVKDFTKEKTVNGIRLVWSELDGCFCMPEPINQGNIRLLFDEKTEIFFPVAANAGGSVYRERTIRDENGNEVKEVILFAPGGNSGESVYDAANKAEISRLNAIAAIYQAVATYKFAIVAGLFWLIGSFFYFVAIAFKNPAKMVGENVGLAISEFSYYAIWGLGIFAGALFFKFAVMPSLLRGFVSNDEPEPKNAQATGQAANVASNSGGDSISLNLNFIKNSPLQSSINER